MRGQQGGTVEDGHDEAGVSLIEMMLTLALTTWPPYSSSPP